MTSHVDHRLPPLSDLKIKSGDVVTGGDNYQRLHEHLNAGLAGKRTVTVKPITDWKRDLASDRKSVRDCRASSISRLRALIPQSGPAERPMRTDYNCKRSLVGEERRPHRLPSGTPATARIYSRQRASVPAALPVYVSAYHFVAPTKPVPTPESFPPALSRSECAECARMRPADYLLETEKSFPERPRVRPKCAERKTRETEREREREY